MELIRKTFLCTEKQIKMIEELKKKTGIKTATGIFDLALLALYNEQKNGIK